VRTVKNALHATSTKQATHQDSAKKTPVCGEFCLTSLACEAFFCIKKILPAVHFDSQKHDRDKKRT